MSEADPGPLESLEARVVAARGSNRRSDREVLADSLLEMAAALIRREDGAAAVPLLAEFLDEFRNEPARRSQVVYAAYAQADALETQKSYGRALSAYTLACEWWTEDVDEDLPFVLPRALWGRARCLQRIGKAAEAAVVSRGLTKRFSAEPAAPVQAVVAEARIGLASLAKTPEEAIDELDAVGNALAKAHDPALFTLAAEALVRKGDILDETDHIRAMDVYQQLVTQFGETVDGAVAEWVLLGMEHAAISLAANGRHSEALQWYADLRVIAARQSPTCRTPWVATALDGELRIAFRSGDFPAVTSIASPLLKLLQEPDSPLPESLAVNSVAALAVITNAKQWATADGLGRVLVARLPRSFPEHTTEIASASVDAVVAIARYSGETALAAFGGGIDLGEQIIQLLIDTAEAELSEEVPFRAARQAAALFLAAIMRRRLDEPTVADELDIELRVRAARSRDPISRIIALAL